MADTNVLIKAIERLDHRVTIGDVAAEAGLPLHEAQQGMLTLASEVQAHLQVSETGEIAYVFPKNIQGILLSKSWKLRWQATWEKVWRILFYLIRISFGIVLILSLVLIVLAIIAISIAATAASQQGDDRRDSRSGGGMIFIPRMWLGPDLFRMFDYRYYRRPAAQPASDSKMNFLEAIFSFLFGDGDPNADLEERRWQAIASVVKASGGVVVAEQVAPFLSDLGQGWSKEFEDFMIPVLSRFNGVPQVSAEGGIVYQFPELQVTAQERKRISPPQFLQELPRKFSNASSGQIMGAIALGSANLIAALALGSMLQDQALVASAGELAIFVSSIYWLLLGYGSAFLGIPIVRYFWVQRQNSKITRRNQEREQRAEVLAQLDDPVREKLSFAQTLAGQTIVTAENLAYTTETDLTDQEIANKDKIDEEWRQLIERRQSS
ncbi:hypothetical protein GFS31_12460 [Leptolyngbya sp. BL0902]|uniref:hypothetical protein n=1 Tax=Leptolyngbya sp. BL0902 TaxID=1115757 RepID=UPI0018E8EF74|nr:hypothetical protein [Leptolyngbya sp. BL0902]QQE64565.1 hypothetical protein GFS31_12460 [Leptolyngbya sp. BL0902]